MSTIVKISRISRLEVVCKNPHTFAPPDIELIYIVEKHRTLININCVGKFLHGDGAGDSIVWVGNMGPFGINGKEERGDSHRVPENDHGEEIEATRR